MNLLKQLQCFATKMMKNMHLFLEKQKHLNFTIFYYLSIEFENYFNEFFFYIF